MHCHARERSRALALQPELRLRLPTEEFTQEHHAVRRYTPDVARRSDDEARLVDQFVLLGYPDGYA